MTRMALIHRGTQGEHSMSDELLGDAEDAPRDTLSAKLRLGLFP
jgi:hypothetical protein